MSSPKNKKLKKKSQPVGSREGPWILAQALFCDPTVHDEPYRWQSWGLVIRDIREFMGMDQSIFGRLLKGYTRGQISRYEMEETEPPVDFWVKMMRTFGLNTNWALTGVGLPYIMEFCDSEERKRCEEWVVLLDEKEDFVKKIHGWG